MNKRLIFILCFGVFGIAAFSQNAKKISEVLSCGEVSKGHAPYFLYVLQNLDNANVNDDRAFSILSEQSLFDAGEDAAQKISLSKSCYLIARTANMKGGILYSIFKSERYAFRECKALGIIPAYADPNQKVSGTEFLAILNEFEKKGR